ncbi:MAG: hypothetical protein GC168_09335 [Candidatus Hydrogenedens sp.]|nr:hypothetical protein [Candidatus Hydrogenedens sp.]
MPWGTRLQFAGILLIAHCAVCMGAGAQIIFESEPERQLGGIRGFGAVFSPDSTMFAQAAGNAVTLHDSSDGAETGQLLIHSAQVTALAIAPDGRYLAAGTSTGNITIWDLETNQRVFSFGAHTGRVYSIVYSPDGSEFVSSGQDRYARIWNANNGALRQAFRHILSGLSYLINATAYSPDGQTLVTCGEDGTLYSWNRSTGTPVRTFNKTSYDLNDVTFVSDSEFVTAAEDGTVRLWNTGATLAFDLIVDLTTSAWSVTPVPGQAQTILVGQGNASARTYDLITGNEQIVYAGHLGNSVAARISPDGRRIVTSSINAGETFLWDAAVSAVVTTYRTPGEIINVARLNAAEDRVVIGMDYTGATIWDIESNTPVRTVAAGYYVETAAFHPTLNAVFIGGNESRVRLWDIASGAQLREYSGHTGNINSLDLTPNGALLATGSSDREARIWDTSSQQLLMRFTGHSQSINAVAITPDGRWLATGSADDTAILWNTDTGIIVQRFTGHRGDINAVDISDDGKWVLTGANDGTARMWSSDTGVAVVHFDHFGLQVNSVVFSPDRTAVFTGVSDGTSRVFDAQTSVELERYTGHNSSVRSISLSSDGLTAVTAGSDRAVHLRAAVESCTARCAGQTQDTDGDGLSDCYEQCIYLNPNSADTDSDGMPDGYEVANFLLRRFPDRDVDKDNDGLGNYDEFVLGTSPIDPDSDDDGMLDGDEVRYNFDPLVDDADGDRDEDGLDNVEETRIGTSPNEADSDGDTMLDGYEVFFRLNPTTQDANSDYDLDGLTNLEELELRTHPVNSDTDGDRLSDGYEVEHGLNPLLHDSDRDTDGDGLSNMEEQTARTHPNDPNDPPQPTYVAPERTFEGSPNGSLEKPFLSITAAMLDVARYSYFYPATIQALEGDYIDAFTLGSNITLEGQGPDTVFRRPPDKALGFIGSGSNSRIRNCTIALGDDFYLGSQAMLDIKQGPFNAENVIFEGTEGVFATGIQVSTSNATGSKILDCTFRNLGTGVSIYDVNARVGRCLFEGITGSGIQLLHRSGSFVAPTLGSTGTLPDTGFNRFRDVSGIALELVDLSSTLVRAQWNDWGRYRATDINDTILRLGNTADGTVNFLPYVTAPLEDGDAVIVPRNNSSVQIFEESDHAAVEINGQYVPINDRGYSVFRDLAPGVYEYVASADKRCSVVGRIRVKESGISVEAPILPAGEGYVPYEGEATLEGETCFVFEGEAEASGTEAETQNEGAPEGDEEGQPDGAPEGEPGPQPVRADLLLDRFAEMDVDGDRQLSFSEVNAVLNIPPSRLVPLDLNEDGILSFGELQQSVAGFPSIHSADTNGNHQLELTEFLRVVQLYKVGGYRCAFDLDTEDGYVLATPESVLPRSCRPHSSDYRGGADGTIDLSETLRAIQLYNFGAIASCPGAFEDDFCNGS